MTIINQGIDKGNFSRFLSLFEDARITLERAIDDQVREARFAFESKQANNIERLLQVSGALQTLNISPNASLSKELIERRTQEALQQYERLNGADRGDILLAAQLLLKDLD